MRVLIYSPSDSSIIGGKEIYSVLLGISLRQLGCQSTVFLSLGRTFFISSNLDELKNLLEDNFSSLKKSRYPRNSKLNKFLREKEDQKILTKLISENDILHVNSPTPAFNFFPLRIKKLRKYTFRGWMKAKSVTKIPIILVLHGTPNESFPHSLRYIEELNKIERNIVLSNLAKEFLLNQGLRNSINVIPTGVDTQIFHPESNENKKEFFNIIFVARIEKAKGFDELIESFIFCRKKGLKIKLKIIGKHKDSEYRINIEEKIREVQTDIEFIEEISHNKMPEIYRTSDLFVLPSHFEGVPLSVLEAMSTALPVIATKVGGIPEIIQNKKNGILVDKGDVKTLSQTIELLYFDEKYRKKLGANARKTILENYDWSIISKKIIELYNELVN